MPKQDRKKIGTMECKACQNSIDVKEQKNGVAYAHCGHCGLSHKGGMHSNEPLGGLEHIGAVIIDNSITNNDIKIKDSTVGTITGDVGETKTQINNNKENEDDDDWTKW